MRRPRAELERRVDELAALHSGHEFADAVRRYSESLDELDREELKAILLLRARAFDDAVAERFEARGWFRRTFDRMSEVERRRRA